MAKKTLIEAVLEKPCWTCGIEAGTLCINQETGLRDCVCIARAFAAFPPGAFDSRGRLVA